jgi:hypothetical protein
MPMLLAVEDSDASSLQNLPLASLPDQMLLYFVARTSLRKILQPRVHRRLHQPSRLHTISAKPEDQQAHQEVVNGNES